MLAIALRPSLNLGSGAESGALMHGNVVFIALVLIIAYL